MSQSPPPRSVSPADAGSTAPWTCPACGVSTAALYCAACGEKRTTPEDLGVAALLGQGLESLANTDGRVFRTFATLLRPGALTLAYLRGDRRRYIAPVQLFLTVNVVFFFIQALLGFHSLSSTLDSHLENQRYSYWAGPLADRVLAERGTTRAQYAPVFERAETINAKALAVAMVPMLALLAWLLSPLRRRPLVAHIVFGFHFEAFFLLLMCLAAPLVVLVLTLSRVPDSYLDVLVSWIAIIAPSTWYAHVAFGRIYGGPFWARALKAAVFAILLIGVLRVYRLIVFLVTFYTTT
jgi:hypothetical protein